MVAGGREGFQQLAGDGGRGRTKPSQDAGLLPEGVHRVTGMQLFLCVAVCILACWLAVLPAVREM